MLVSLIVTFSSFSLTLTNEQLKKYASVRLLYTVYFKAYEIKKYFLPPCFFTCCLFVYIKVFIYKLRYELRVLELYTIKSPAPFAKGNYRQQGLWSGHVGRSVTSLGNVYTTRLLTRMAVRPGRFAIWSQDFFPSALLCLAPLLFYTFFIARQYVRFYFKENSKECTSIWYFRPDMQDVIFKDYKLKKFNDFFSYYHLI